MSFKECACIKKQKSFVRPDGKGFEECQPCKQRLKESASSASGEDEEEEEEKAPSRPKYAPLPYTFRSPGSGAEGQHCKTVRSPPFWLQVDHTLAVIWCIFAPQQTQRKLGITQLQWALEFLKGIRTRRGDYPKDVLVCIQAIEDRLIEQYAGMQRVIKQTKTCCGVQTCTVCGNKDDASPEESKTQEDVAKSEDGSVKEENVQEEPVFGPCPGGLVEKSLPLSITYEALLQRSPHPCSLPPEPMPQEVILDENIEENPSDLPFNLPAAIRGAIPAGSVPSKNDLLTLLNKFRREQVDRIQSELDRLHSIEKYMSNVDKDSFVPFTDQVDANKSAETEQKPSPRTG